MKCKGCGRTINMTWTLVSRQYNRMIKRGLTKAEAKAASPRCQKCATKLIQEHGARRFGEQ